MTRTMIAMLIATSAASVAAAAPLPVGIAAQIPSGYEVLASAHIAAGQPVRDFEIVALGRQGETARSKSGNAPPRPLIVFERRGGRFVLAGRNDDVVFAADSGGQCDPFLDGDATIAGKGRYFTVQNGVACGQHWTDYITFRLDDQSGSFVFDNERTESWKLSPSNDPHAEALVPESPPRLIRDRPGRVTSFQAWRLPARPSRSEWNASRLGHEHEKLDANPLRISAMVEGQHIVVDHDDMTILMATV